jgi:UDP:flavonoid glycosyltransferase YjiC (YdhE family)
MRVLFTFAGGTGHFIPLASIARAAHAVGHVVAFACQGGMLSTVERAGFVAFDTGGDTLVGAEARLPLLEVDTEREERAIRDGFAGPTARVRAAKVLELCDGWRPDLLVRDEVDFGTAVVAERLGLPHASVLVTAAGAFLRAELVALPLNALRAEHGLTPDPDLAMLSRYLVLSPFPPSYRDPADPLPTTGHSFRATALDGAAKQRASEWIADLPKTATVYFTLGTVFNQESGDLFTRVLAGVRDLPVNLVVTVGPQIDPAELGDQPSNVRVERYVDQSLLLPHCSVVVSHAGSGSVLGALAHGLPMVLIPIGADQPLNAARCLQLGLAQVLDATAATPECIRQAVSEVLADPSYRRAAERIRDEIAGLPDASHAVSLLETLVR